MSLLALLLAACGPGKITLDGPSESGETGETAPPPVPTLTLAGPQALDPLLAPAVSLTLAQTYGETVTVELLDGTGAAVRTLADGSGWVDTVTVDGLDDAGQALPVGAYTVHASLAVEGEEVAVTEAPLWIVRVGVSAGTLGGDRIPLLWHDAGGMGMYYESTSESATFTLAAIDAEGAALPIPAPWADIDAPPEDPVGQNFPAAYTWDAVPTLALSVAGDTAGAPVHATITGWTPDADALAAGDEVTFTSDTPLSTTVGVLEPTLTLEWRTGDDVFATQAIPLRIYALYGPPAFAEVTPPHEPWVAVIDPLLRARGGVEPTFEAVSAAVVDYVYWDNGLAYDTRSGASAYTQYQRNYDGATFNLTAFLSRSRGSIVNCTDCASIVETFGKMVGLDLSYAIVLDNFDLNYIRAIGGDEYTHCPFGNGGCGFRYHAVVTPDDAGTIYDATLALDGDDDPGSTPNVEMMVHAVPGDEYLDRLVMSGNARYDYVQHGDFR